MKEKIFIVGFPSPDAFQGSTGSEKQINNVIFLCISVFQCDWAGYLSSLVKFMNFIMGFRLC